MGTRGYGTFEYCWYHLGSLDHLFNGGRNSVAFGDKFITSYTSFPFLLALHWIIISFDFWFLKMTGLILSKNNDCTSFKIDFLCFGLDPYMSWRYHSGTGYSKCHFGRNEVFTKSHNGEKLRKFTKIHTRKVLFVSAARFSLRPAQRLYRCIDILCSTISWRMILKGDHWTLIRR